MDDKDLALTLQGHEIYTRSPSSTEKVVYCGREDYLAGRVVRVSETVFRADVWINSGEFAFHLNLVESFASGVRLIAEAWLARTSTDPRYQKWRGELLEGKTVWASQDDEDPRYLDNDTSGHEGDEFVRRKLRRTEDGWRAKRVGRRSFAGIPA